MGGRGAFDVMGIRSESRDKGERQNSGMTEKGRMH